MLILLIMCAGIAVGHFFFYPKYKPVAEKLQVVATVLLIFSMGVMLGKRENFLHELATLGWKSLIFCLVPSVLSALLVFVLTRQFIETQFHSTKDK